MGSRDVSTRVARQDRTRRDVVLPLSDQVTATLQGYADRGVFRGFRATPAARRRVEYEFQWLTGRPTRAIFDAARGVLAFPSLFPDVDARSPMAAALEAVVRSRTERGQPAHRRIDARRARVTGAVRRGDWGLTVTIRGSHHEYAARGALNLINELFLALQDAWPDYLIERFGFPTE